MLWPAGRRAVFFDRDGVLNELVVRGGMAASPLRIEEFQLCWGAADAVRRVRRLGLRVFVVSNQPDIARGLLAPRDLERMTAVLRRALPIDEVCICPHDDVDQCECRKPKPGMLLTLAQRWKVSLSHSFVVGDSWKDMEAGRRAGCRTILLDKRGDQLIAADCTVPDLGVAVTVVESIVRNEGGA